MRQFVLSGLAVIVCLSAGNEFSAEEMGDSSPAKKYHALIQAQEKKLSPSDYTQQFLTLIRDHPSDPVALEAFLWLTSRAPHFPEADKAVEVMVTNWTEHERLSDACKLLGRRDCPAAERFLRAAIVKSERRAVQGYARFSLAVLLGKTFGLIASELPDDERESQKKEIETLLLQAIAGYGDLEYFRKTLGEAAEMELFELRNLATGQISPEIEGTNLDGKKMKLSDFRGNLVLLKFWGHW